MKIHIDLETYSEIDIFKYGMHKYVEDPSFEILLMAVAMDDGPVAIYDLTVNPELPGYLLEVIEDPDNIKIAHNAAFEIRCLRKYGLRTGSHEWVCTAVMAAELGLPRGLGDLTGAVKLPEDKAKSKDGKALIRYFCKPCKPTKINGKRTRNLPIHDPDKWERFKAYCVQDVVAERTVYDMLSKYWIDPQEWDNWRLDQIINNRGAFVDMELVENILKIKKEMNADLMKRSKLITGLENPNSRDQLKGWIEDQLDTELEDMTATTVQEVIEDDIKSSVTNVLQMRQKLSKTSLKKYDALVGATCADGRIRGTLLFYGASRTGRWAGRVFQPQNLPRNYLPGLAEARQIAKFSDYTTMRYVYDDVADVLGQLIRTSIIPKPGFKFIVADYSAVEARNLAWYAQEDWRLKVFRGDGKIYEASAAAAFNIPIEQVVKGSHWRAQGKVLELACGYGGSVGAIGAMDYNNDIPVADRKSLVAKWREASPHIVDFWWKVGNAAIKAVTKNTEVILEHPSGGTLIFKREMGYLFITLPSGRRLAYPRPMMWEGKYGDELSYEGVDQYTKRWGRIGTYGPKLVENIVQATCRDLLMYGMTQLEVNGYPVVMHVHDEAIVEVPMDVEVETIEAMLALKPKWAKTMPHQAEGFETMFYKKD